MENVKISSLITAKISGVWGTEALTKEAVSVIRTANFTNSGIISYKNVVKREIEQKVVDKKKLLDGDIIIEKSGGSPNQPVGRVVYFKDPNNEVLLCNNFTTILRPNRDKVSPKYLFYLLYNFYQTEKVLVFQNKTTGIINLKLDRYLDSEISYEPDLETQNKIVAILDKAKVILDKREKTIQMYDELLRATFWEMFGDPTSNANHPLRELKEKQAVKLLGGYAFKSSGFQKVGIPVIKIGTVNKGFFDISTLSFLPEEEKDNYQKYLIQSGDILITLTGTIGKDDFANVCKVEPFYPFYLLNQRVAKFIIDANIYNKAFIYHLFKHPKTKGLLQEKGKGVRQANISNEHVESLKLICPPIDLQNKFELKIASIQKIIDKVKSYRNKADLLLKCLSQEVFSERITIDVDAELEALINAIDLDKKDEEINIDTLTNDITFIQRLIDRLNKQEFEDRDQYDKAKYILFRIMKEEVNFVKQIFKDNKIELTLQNEIT